MAIKPRLGNEMLKFFIIGCLAVSISVYGYGQVEEESVQNTPPADSQRFVCLDSTQVLVQVLSKPLPTQEDSLRTFLWENFILGPEPERFNCLVWGWRRRAESFANSLVHKARVDSLDAESLRVCITHVLDDAGRYAYLPISASFGNFGGKPVWVILVKWEWEDSSSREVVGHARVYVLDSRDATQLGFVTCG